MYSRVVTFVDQDDKMCNSCIEYFVDRLQFVCGVLDIVTKLYWPGFQ